MTIVIGIIVVVLVGAFLFKVLLWINDLDTAARRWRKRR